MKTAVPMLAMLIACGACRNEAPAEAPPVANVWVRLPALPGRPGAAYFTVRGGAREARLIRISSPQAERFEMHGSGMRPLGAQTVPAGGELVFGPGGNHAMVHGIAAPRPLGRITMTFHFDSGPDVTVRAPLIPAGLPEPRFVPSATNGDRCEEEIRREGDVIIATNCAQ